jgi:hypothetical protein
LSTRADYTFVRRIERRPPNCTLIGAVIRELEQTLKFPDRSRAVIGMAPMPDHRGRRVPIDGAARLHSLKPTLGFILIDLAMFEPEVEQPFFESDHPLPFRLIDVRFESLTIDPSRAHAIARALLPATE